MLWTKHGFPKIGWKLPKKLRKPLFNCLFRHFGSGLCVLESLGSLTWRRLAGAHWHHHKLHSLADEDHRIDRRIGRADIDVMPVQRFGAERACRLKHRNGALGIYCRDWLGSVLDVVLVARLPFMGCGEAECSIGVFDNINGDATAFFDSRESLPEHGEHPRDVQVREQNLSVAWDNLFPVREILHRERLLGDLPFRVGCPLHDRRLHPSGRRFAERRASALGCCCIRHDKHRAVGGDKILAGIENEIEDEARFVLGDKP